MKTGALIAANRVALGGGGGGSPTYDPIEALDTKLLLYFDAEDFSSFTLTGNSVDEWRDQVQGYAVQAGSGGTGDYNATSFNGGPCYESLGGSANYLSSDVDPPLPSGADPCEMFLLVDVQGDVASTSARFAVAYGNSSSDSRRFGRGRVADVHRLRASIGDGATEIMLTGDEDIAGLHVLRAYFGATTTTSQVDDNATKDVAVVPATVLTRFRIAAAASGTPGNYFDGRIAKILICDGTLTTEERTALVDWLQSYIS